MRVMCIGLCFGLIIYFPTNFYIRIFNLLFRISVSVFRKLWQDSVNFPLELARRLAILG